MILNNIMKQFSLFIASLLLTLAVAAQNITYDVNFTHTREMKTSGKTIVKSGHLLFDGNDQLTMNYTDPEGEYFIVDGNIVKMNLNGKKTEVKADKVKAVDLQRTTLLNCLAGNWQEAAKANNAESMVAISKGIHTVKLAAKGKVQRGGYSSVELTYRTSDGKLLKMVLVESTGIKNTYEMVP